MPDSAASAAGSSPAARRACSTSNRSQRASRTEPVTGVCASPVGARVSFAAGPDEELAGLFVSTAIRQRAPFAERLGLELNPSGCVRVDPFGRTSLPGVHAAGDMAHLPELPMPMASVMTAAASGQAAASSLVAFVLH